MGEIVDYNNATGSAGIVDAGNTRVMFPPAGGNYQFYFFGPGGFGMGPFGGTSLGPGVGGLGELGGQVIRFITSPLGDGAKIPIATVVPLVEYPLKYCRYLTFDPIIPAGKKVKILIEENEKTRPVGAVEIFVTPLGGFNPATNGAKPPGEPKITFGGNGTTDYPGPGILTIHLKNDTPPPNITVRFVDQ